MLIGSHTAKIDDKGRLKLPAAYRSQIEEQHGTALFITSIHGDCARLYPLPVWLALLERLARIPSADKARERFLARVNYYGQHAEFDTQGRVSLPPRLRESAAIVGEVDVVGQMDFLAVWNHDRLVKKLEEDPYTDQDANVLASAGL